MIELVRAGRRPDELAKEFEPTAQSIANWVAQADRDESMRKDGLATGEREELNRLRRENRQLRLEREILSKSRGLVRSGDGFDSSEVFEFVKRRQANYPIATMCRLLGLSTSGYYARRDRPPSKRAKSDAVLTERIAALHERSRGTYGVPRIHADLAAEGQRVGRKRVGRLMQGAGLAGVSGRRGVRTTVRDREARPAPDLVTRDFNAQSVDRLWVADITYIPTWAGFLYLAGVLDVCSRRVVGWSMAIHLRSELVLEALNMAISQRRPTEVIHHSDQGMRYTSIAFGLRCREVGVKPSTGDCPLQRGVRRRAGTDRVHGLHLQPGTSFTPACVGCAWRCSQCLGWRRWPWTSGRSSLKPIGVGPGR
jgi:transposase InsO family protein